MLNQRGGSQRILKFSMAILIYHLPGITTRSLPLIPTSCTSGIARSMTRSRRKERLPQHDGTYIICPGVYAATAMVSSRCAGMYRDINGGSSYYKQQCRRFPRFLHRTFAITSSTSAFRRLIALTVIGSMLFGCTPVCR